jgi:hypothetical protein
MFAKSAFVIFKIHSSIQNPTFLTLENASPVERAGSTVI